MTSPSSATAAKRYMVLYKDARGQWRTAMNSPGMGQRYFQTIEAAEHWAATRSEASRWKAWRIAERRF